MMWGRTVGYGVGQIVGYSVGADCRVWFRDRV